MGVKDLWLLLSPAGRRISIETLEGKVLAIDVSIWLTQFIKAMRDDDGKLVKNAHLIGTLRRVLKLLYHRIRPIFVFDGSTPALKLETLKFRRAIRDRHETNKKSIAQRILLAQLKQAAMRKEEPSQFVEEFVPLESIHLSNHGMTKQNSVDCSDDDVEWTEGFENLKAKKLSDSDNESKSGDEDWKLPDNCDEINIDVMSNLPSQIRKQLIEEARRKERARSRSNYIPVATDPALYSQTQLVNFLHASKLNRKFEQVQEVINGKSQGKAIAADGSKKYSMVRTMAANGFVSEEVRIDDNNSDSDVDWSHVKESPPVAAVVHKHRQRLVVMDDESEEPVQGESPAAAATAQSSQPTIGRSRGAAVEQSDIVNSATPNESWGSVSDRGCVAAVSTVAHFGGGFMVGQQEAADDAAERIPSFYDNLHADSDSEAGFDDVQWSSGSSAVGAGGSADDADSGAEDVEGYDVGEGEVKDHLENTVALDLSEDLVEVSVPVAVSSQSHAPSASASGGAAIDLDMVRRMVTAAAGMGDWAGRVVGRTLKAHVTQSSSSAGASSEVVTAAQSVAAADIPAVADAKEVLMQFEAEEVQGRRALASALRDSEGVSNEMKDELIQLLQVFNLPFIIAPFEAEAQCAVLEQLGVVDGVVTEDSDTFLFGAKHVYRNIFQDQKYVEVYCEEDIERELGLCRENLIALSYFLGSDYTDGVSGVGIVNGMEIIEAFPFHRVAHSSSEGSNSSKRDSNVVLQDILNGLGSFRKWLEGYRFGEELISNASAAEEDESMTPQLKKFQEKHKSARSKWSVPDKFPDPLVAKEYLEPKANRSSEAFSWDIAPSKEIAEYCRNKLGWTNQEVEGCIAMLLCLMMMTQIALKVDPVIAKFNERTRQTRIDSHFIKYTDSTHFAKFASDRLKSSVSQITGKRAVSERENKKRPRKKAKVTDS